ncbi:MAG TPA: FtsQ-type POTRA domain-containing protein [Marinagarivorans sp.]
MAWGIYRLEPLAIIQQHTNKPIASVNVQGDFKYVEQAKIEALVAEKLTDTFLELDIVGLKDHLEKHPWIDRAIVTRQWPDTLLIKISEQQPIARWNSKDFLNLRGEIVNLADKTELNHLPLLKADDRYAEKVMQQYVLVAKLLGNYKFAPLVLELDNTLAWSLEVSPAIEVRLGRDDVLVKLQRLMQVLTTELVDQVRNIEAVDMRYKQGFSVAWKQPLEMDAASEQLN